MAKTMAERKAEQRDRDRASGYIEVSVKIHKDNKDRLRGFVDKIENTNRE